MKVYYIAQFNDKITDCEDFDNNFFKCENFVLGFVKDTDESGIGLSGQINLLETAIDDYMVNLNIYKETPVGMEFMYSVEGNLCDNFKQEDSPWYPLLKTFNKSECPVEPEVFNVEQMVISLDFAKDVLRHEYCGSYIVEMTTSSSSGEALSCHNIPVEIVEKSCDES
ncbi:unnamed protein product [Danaus chrysippus]|uniref:(African queen) hypothetical protein n=1 Tax=Danaus chrysippus TaxID=151541 RepID=A0A8J2R2X9_9NEOP|nr:unnamed protein product [Danaus chrysippus]